MDTKINTEQPLMMPPQCVECKFYDGFGQCLERGDNLKDNCEKFEPIEDCDMDCEEKYNAALERARELSKTVTGAQYEYIFPELKEGLKETEDEKMWKLLKKYVRYNISDMALEVDHITRKELESWLEKQIPIDKEGIKKGALKYVADLFMEWLDVAIPGCEIPLSNVDCKIIENAFLKENWPMVARYIRENLEEQDPCIGCTNDKGCVTCEKGNLKEINVELKFKPGDWITNGGANPCYVKFIFEDYYELCSCEGFEFTKLIIDVNYVYHLWTIQDAKDGDVLASKDGNTVLIFRNLYSDESFSSYYNTTGQGQLDWSRRCFIPATKEQRDLLAKKMKEDGWEWDSEKKKLIEKIELVSKESDCEKIRKNIIELVRQSSEVLNKQNQKDMLDWLERQGENTLDADKVIEWLRENICTACYNEPDVGQSQRIDKFKKDFGL